VSDKPNSRQNKQNAPHEEKRNLNMADVMVRRDPNDWQPKPPEEVLVSKTADESLYFRLHPLDMRLDGRVERDGENFDVPFWSYAAKAETSPITTTTFHKNLWGGKPSDKEWVKKFWTREESFSKEELDSLKDVSKYTGAAVEPKPKAKPTKPKPEEQKVEGQKINGQRVKTARISLTPQPAVEQVRTADVTPFEMHIKRASNPSPSAIDNAVSLIPGGPDVVRGATGGRGGNLATLLRWWRPRMMADGGFRRCLATLADHPELYPLENICAWLHHETTGLWPNEGCHHPGMKNCRRKARKLVHGELPKNGSILSDNEFARKLSKLRSATPKKKDAQDGGNSVQNEINFKALAYLTATGVKIRHKSGLFSSNSRSTRALESLVSYTIPGDMSRVRKPGRSTLYRAATPGGGGHRDRIGGDRGFRCPPGFQHGGKFTDRHFTTCGPRLFEKPGATDEVAKATREVVGATTEIAQGMVATALGAKKPKTGIDITPGDYSVPVEIQRAAEVAAIGKASPAKVAEAIMVNASLVYEDKKTPGKLVRRDGSIMDLSVPIDKIASVKNMNDMKDGFLISRVDDPAKMGDAQMPTLNSDLKGFVLALPGDNHIRVSKTPKATPAAMKGVNRRFNALKDAEQTFAYGSALSKAIEEAKGNLSLDYHMPGIKNPTQVIQIQRDGAYRSVIRWVYELFLAESAPARNKATKPWKLATEAQR
jgi:hypothetical protein